MDAKRCTSRGADSGFSRGSRTERRIVAVDREQDYRLDRDMRRPTLPHSETSIRRDEKPGRAFEGGGAVRVFSEGGYFVARLNLPRDAEHISRLLAAPNAVPVRKHGGKLVGIRLLSFGDDRGHSCEQHGTSIITTERVVNDLGVYVGSDRNLKHKAENVNHATAPPAWAAEVSRGGPVRVLLAAKR